MVPVCAENVSPCEVNEPSYSHLKLSSLSHLLSLSCLFSSNLAKPWASLVLENCRRVQESHFHKEDKNHYPHLSV